MQESKSKSRRAKIQRTSVVDQVYEAIKQDILDHVWVEGDKIPSEGELAEYFGVNRLSVRMALQKLSTLGLIETRVGEGSFVSHFSLQPYFNEIAPLYSNVEYRQDVEQLRNLLEGECMNIAIQSATQEQKAKLKECLDAYNQLETEYNKNPDDLDLLEVTVAADFAFHYEIICMSGNHLYMDVYKMVQNVVTGHIRHLIYTRSHTLPLGATSQWSHEVIYNSIINGDAQKAKEAREMMLGVVPLHQPDYYEDYDPNTLKPE